MATTFMNLNLPVPTTTSGPQWASDVNTAVETIDSHDHSSGKGKAIPAAALNINEDLDINENHLNEVASVRLTSQSASLTGSDDVRNVYVVNGELYYNNSAGTAIAITSNGSIATPSSTNTPAGIVLPYAGVSAPTGYLICDGTAVSRVTYSSLFAIIGTIYGTGDGSTTFNLPNMNGRAPMGVGSYTDSVSGVVARTLAQEIGAEKHVVTTDQMPAHTHPIYNTTGADALDRGQNYAMTGRADPPATGNVTLLNVTASSTGGGLAHNNMQPSLGLNFIIKT